MTTKTRGIQWRWSIHRDGYRRATDKQLGVHVVVRNQLSRQGWGGILWFAFDANGMLAKGEVTQGTRYASLVRQAMYDAELAAEACVCDDCGRVRGHDMTIEH